MSQVLVTGATGFIGKALCKKLREIKMDVLEFEGNIYDEKSFTPFEKANISHCFHLAAKTFVPDSWLYPENFMRINVIGTQNVLNLCKNKNISLTYISAYLYGIPEQLPISENTPVRPNNPYALSKHLAEQLCSFYATEYQLPVAVIRPFNVYGPGQDDKFLIPSIITQVIEKEEIKVKDLSPKRDYIFIDDLVDSIIASMFKKQKYAVYNIASGVSYSVQEVIDIVQKITKTNKKIISEQVERPNEILDTVANIERAKKELGWLPKYSFEQGIAETISTKKNP